MGKWDRNRGSYLSFDVLIIDVLIIDVLISDVLISMC